MRFLRRAGAAIGLFLFALVASASPADPKDSVEYLTLPEAQQTDSGSKVEVVEFFSYACPHCSAFEPSLAEWVKKQNGQIVFKRVPVAYRAQWVPLQKLYYVLEALGKTEEMHAKVFNAVHRDRLPYDNDAVIADLAVRIGLDRKQFLDVYNSFAVQTKLRRAAQLQDDYKITGVPTLAVAGRYETSPGILADHGLKQPEPQLFTSTLQVMDYLVGMAGKK